MSNKIFVYEQFLKCKDYTFDPYWREIFDDCASNRFPRGAKYDNIKNIIYVRVNETSTKQKTEINQIPENPKDMYALLMHIFKDILGLRSDHDINLSNQELEEIRKKSEVDLDCEWKQLKPKAVKNQIILNFSNELIKKHKLPEKKIKHLYNIIQLGFQFKKLTNDDVNYKKGVIISIKGLEYNKTKKKFHITNVQKNVSRVEAPVIKHNKIHQSIDRWLREYKQQIIL